MPHEMPAHGRYGRCRGDPALLWARVHERHLERRITGTYRLHGTPGTRRQRYRCILREILGSEPVGAEERSPGFRTTSSSVETTTSAPPSSIAESGGVTTAGSTAVAEMPGVPCGMDLQTAQDLEQEAGACFSRSVDATGAGRMQILDSNWVVVCHEPPPGTPIDDGDPVFWVVRRSEFTAC